MTFNDVLPHALVFIKGLIILVSVIFLISGLDDFFIDIFYAVRQMYRKLFVMRKYQPLTVDHLLLAKEQNIAIMVPAWDESKVIRRMLENTLHTLNYSVYHIFVGTYPNDASTQREVDGVGERFGNVHRINCHKPGPTNKADCLNWIYQGIQDFEKESKIEFQIFVLEDSADILHPLCLKLFNYMIPRTDMVQLPLFPLETKWYRFSSGHYIDEFSESHSKDMLVRERLSQSLPSVGVGCAFSRRALETMAAKNKNQLFNIQSLTENYDFGLRLKQIHAKEIFVKHGIERVTTRRSFWTRKLNQVTTKEYVATREYFPVKFWAAVRQKSRWILGIALQGWVNLGWRGGGWTKYMLSRDRKSLLTHQANMLGSVIAFAGLIFWLANRLFPDSYHFPALIEEGSWLWWIIVADIFLLLVRLFQRAFSVQKIYGWKQAFLSVPRLGWGNVVNFMATIRAIYLFFRYLVNRKEIAWDKTDHIFPSKAELMPFHRKLGDLLLEKQFITAKQLNEALMVQRENNRPLGAILIEMGLVKEDELIQVLGMQLQLSSKEIDAYQIPLELLRLLPRDLAIQYSVFPVEMRKGGRLVVAANNPLIPEEVEILEKAIDRHIEICLSSRSDIAFAIQRGYERLEGSEEKAPEKDRLGKILLARNIITEEQLQEALKVQRRSYSRLGEILVEERVISPRSLKEAIKDNFSETHGRLGAFLVQNHYITLDQLEQALQLQRMRSRRLGDVMVDLGMISDDALQQILKESVA